MTHRMHRRQDVESKEPLGVITKSFGPLSGVDVHVPSEAGRPRVVGCRPAPGLLLLQRQAGVGHARQRVALKLRPHLQPEAHFSPLIIRSDSSEK